MRFLRFPASRTDGSLIQLRDFLVEVPDNDWVWSVVDFWGVGVAPAGLSMEEFEAAARAARKGYLILWPDLKRFAEALDQTYDCLIVGAKRREWIPDGRFDKERCRSCEVVIEALDSTEWFAWAEDPLIQARFATVGEVAEK